jgi:hypothetical protein
MLLWIRAHCREFSIELVVTAEVVERHHAPHFPVTGRGLVEVFKGLLRLAGDAFELFEQPGHDITVQGLWQIVFGGGTPDEARQAIELLPHLDDGWIRRLRKLAG